MINPAGRPRRSPKETCGACGSTAVYRRDDRLDDQARCWDCWVAAIGTWRTRMRAAGRCPNCGTPSRPYIFCQKCRTRRAKSGPAKRTRDKIAAAEREAAKRQETAIKAGERLGREALDEWRSRIDESTLLTAFTAASGDRPRTCETTTDASENAPPARKPRPSRATPPKRGLTAPETNGWPSRPCGRRRQSGGRARQQ